MSYWDDVKENEKKIKAKWKQERKQDIATIVGIGPFTLLFIAVLLLLILG